MELQDVLSLTAKLQAAESRALAAEMVIAKMHSSLSDEADYCSDDGPNEAMRWQGKLEFYSRSFRENGYAAARETLRKAGESDALRTERDELAALVEHRSKALKGLANNVKEVARDSFGFPGEPFPISFRENDPEGYEAWTIAVDALVDDAPAALAALRQKIRVEVLEEVAALANEKAVSLMRDSAKAHEDNCPIMGRARLAEARLFDSFAHKIRAMKEAQ